MALIGAGCSAVLMASLYIFARVYPPAVFASLSGLLIGAGSAGNVASAAPMAWVVEAVGWRASLWGLAVASLATALAVLALVRDPGPAPAADGGLRVGFGSVLRRPALLLLVPLTLTHYAPAAGVRGLWAGPYMADVFGLDPVGIGNVTLAMGVAMILGSLAYGPLDRLLGTRKGVLLGGNLAARRRAAGALGPALAGAGGRDAAALRRRLLRGLLPADGGARPQPLPAAPRRPRRHLPQPARDRRRRPGADRQRPHRRRGQPPRRRTTRRRPTPRSSCSSRC